MYWVSSCSYAKNKEMAISNPNIGLGNSSLGLGKQMIIPVEEQQKWELVLLAE